MTTHFNEERQHGYVDPRRLRDHIQRPHAVKPQGKPLRGRDESARKKAHHEKTLSERETKYSSFTSKTVTLCLAMSPDGNVKAKIICNI